MREARARRRRTTPFAQIRAEGAASPHNERSHSRGGDMINHRRKVDARHSLAYPLVEGQSAHGVSGCRRCGPVARQWSRKFLARPHRFATGFPWVVAVDGDFRQAKKSFISRRPIWLNEGQCPFSTRRRSEATFSLCRRRPGESVGDDTRHFAASGVPKKCRVSNRCGWSRYSRDAQGVCGSENLNRELRQR